MSLVSNWVASAMRLAWREGVDYSLSAHEGEVVPTQDGKFHVKDRQSGDALLTFVDESIAHAFAKDYERASMARKAGDKVWAMYWRFSEEGKGAPDEIYQKIMEAGGLAKAKPIPSQFEIEQLQRDILLAPYTFQERIERFRRLRNKGLPYVPIIENEIREFREKPAKPHGVELPAPSGVPDVPTVHDLMYPPARMVARWLSRNCRYAQQQKLLQFDPATEFTGKPTDIMDGLLDYAPEGADQEEWADGFFHVTTNLPAVLHSGQLKSRSQLGVAGAGLGGGVANEAPNKVSVTHSLSRAQALAANMRWACDVAQGVVMPSAILSELQSHFGFDEILAGGALDALLSRMGVPGAAGEDGYWEGLDEWLDANLKTGESRYGFLQSAEEALLTDESRNFDNQAVPFAGFTMPYESWAGVDASRIGIVQVMVRKVARMQHVPGEMELRLDPNDIMLPQDASPVVG